MATRANPQPVQRRHQLNGAPCDRIECPFAHSWPRHRKPGHPLTLATFYIGSHVKVEFI